MNVSKARFGAAFLAAVILCLAGTATIAAAQSGGIYDLGWHKIASGGVTQSGGGVFSLGGTFAQADAGTSAGGVYQLRGGFWTGVAMRQLLDAPDTPTPAQARFALRGFARNPVTRSAMEVSFSLSSAEPARLELLDIGGRRVRVEDVGVLGPGEHRVRFTQSQALEPGVYWLRLRQGHEQKTVKAVVLE